MSAGLEAARRYLARGLAVVPIEAGTKRPPLALSGWEGLRLTEADLPRHFANGEGVGLLLGEPSGGLVDVDLDCDEAVALAPTFLPATGLWSGRTSRPRSHAWFVATPIPATARFQTPPPDPTTLLELRSTGAQTLVPPSRHPSGEAYTWTGRFDEVGQVAGDELAAAVRTLAAAALLARAWPREPGSRHDLANALAGTLARGGWGIEGVGAFVRAIAEAGHDEEARDRERTARATVTKLAAGGRVTGGPTLAALVGEPVVARVREWLGLAGGVEGGTPAEPWAEPASFEATAGPAFPLDALPAPLADWVAEVAETHQVPPDLPAALALGVAAAAAARRAEVQIGSTHREPLNLYLAAVAESGERKGPALRDVLFPLEAGERELRRERAPVITAAKRQRAIEEARLKHLTEQAAKEREATKRDAAADEAKALELALTPVPPMPKLLVGNATIEKLEAELADQGGGLALASEEAGDLFAIAAGRYTKDGGRQLDTLLKAYDGGRVTTDRMTRCGVDIEHPALSILLTPQPSILRGFRTVPEFRERGLLARFLFAVPPSRVGTRLYRNRARKVEARDAYVAAIKRILNLPKPDDPEAVPALRLAGAALDRWAAGADRIEREQAEGGRLAGLRDWASKQPGRVARLAGLVHLLVTPPPAPWAVPIAPDTVEAAWRLGAYFVEHALAAFALIGGESAEVTLARRLLRWIERHGRASFTLRECFRHHQGFASPDALLPALSVLEVRGFIRRRPEPARHGPGRPGSPSWDVNPMTEMTKSPSKRNSVISVIGSPGCAEPERPPALDELGGWGDLDEPEEPALGDLA